MVCTPVYHHYIIYMGPTQWEYMRTTYDVISIIIPLSLPISVASDRINDNNIVYVYILTSTFNASQTIRLNMLVCCKR